MNKIILLIALYLGFSLKIQAQITVKSIHPTQNPLSDSLVRPLAGFGISIFNIQSNLKPSSKSLGSFKGTGNFPLSKGLVLSSGIVDSISRPNKNRKISTRQDFANDTLSNQSIGRQLIQTILYKNSPPSAPMRATEISSISFDFIPSGDSLSFRYIFASEEYPEFVCSLFNDIFGFFIKGPGIEGDSVFYGTALAGYKNLAALSGNGFPVSINTVNNGQSGGNGNVSNCRFSPEGTAQFIENHLNGQSFFSTIAFDGLTKALHAKSKVLPCQTYSLVMVVADVGDRIFDSGVFVEMGSFSSGKLSRKIMEPAGSFGDTLSQCHPGSLIFSRCPNIQEKWTIKLQKSGNMQSESEVRRRLKSGALVAIPDSIVLLPGQAADTLLIEPTEQLAGIRTLEIRALEVKKAEGIYRFLPDEEKTGFSLKSRSHKLSEWQGICPQDSAWVSIQGHRLPGFSYSWLKKNSQQWTPAQNLSSPNELFTKVWPIGQGMLLKLETKNANGSCQFSDSIVIEKFQSPNPVFQILENRVLVSGIPNNFEIIWRKNGQILAPDSLGTEYAAGDSLLLELINPAGCHFTFTNPQIFTSRADKKSEWETLKIFPNPAFEWVELQLKNWDSYSYKIYSTEGKLAKSGQLKQSPKIEISGLLPGIYSLEVHNPNGNHFIKRLVIRKP